jgi:hypothetical protein
MHKEVAMIPIYSQLLILGLFPALACWGFFSAFISPAGCLEDHETEPARFAASGDADDEGPHSWERLWIDLGGEG